MTDRDAAFLRFDCLKLAYGDVYAIRSDEQPSTELLLERARQFWDFVGRGME